jgi:hypothetical protein
VSSNQLSRILWSPIILTNKPADLNEQHQAFDSAAQCRWPAPAAPITTWASTLIHACLSGRIDAEVMWQILLAHVDAPTPPDVAVLLEHLPEARLQELPLPRGSTSTPKKAHQGNRDAGIMVTGQAEMVAGEHDDWFVMIDNAGAA